MPVRVMLNLVVEYEGMKVRIVDMSDPTHVAVRTPQGEVVSIEKALLEEEAIPLHDPDAPLVPTPVYLEYRFLGARKSNFKRDPRTAVCGFCSKEFETIYSTQRYCDDSCRRKHSKKRKKEEVSKCTT